MKTETFTTWRIPLCCLFTMFLSLEVCLAAVVAGPSAFIQSDIQDVTVKGRVPEENGTPIPGVTVPVPGTTVGTATDLDGEYSLSVPEGSTLVFSFIGFISQNVEVGGRTVIDI